MPRRQCESSFPLFFSSPFYCPVHPGRRGELPFPIPSVFIPVFCVCVCVTFSSLPFHFSFPSLFLSFPFLSLCSVYVSAFLLFPFRFYPCVLCMCLCHLIFLSLSLSPSIPLLFGGTANPHSLHPFLRGSIQRVRRSLVRRVFHVEVLVLPYCGVAVVVVAREDGRGDVLPPIHCLSFDSGACVALLRVGS